MATRQAFAPQGRNFRTAARNELVPYDRLLESEREALGELRNEPGFYGVLRPRAGGGTGTLKAVNREAALLLFTLQTPGPLPSYAFVDEGGLGPKQILELVLDGVVEIQEGDSFVSGPEAVLLLCPASPPRETKALAQLSAEALQYAQALPIDDPRRLSTRLYLFNRLPQSQGWHNRLSGVSSALKYVSADAGGPLNSTLENGWALQHEDGPRSWLTWSLRRGRAERAPFQARYKLYISPSMTALPAAFAEAVNVMTARKVERFKLGADSGGLLRPDKFVAYFRSFEALAETAEPLAARLRGAEPHGVPFSAEIACDGLLSWGMDPPPERTNSAWPDAPSWRAWVTGRLASALIYARSQPSESVPPWRFALERLRIEGVDVDDWIPSATIWRSGAPTDG